MRWWFVLLCGCNQVFGLPQTEPIDAGFFDAPPRQTPRCPDIGGLPAFTPTLHQLHLDCLDYTTASDSDLAAGLCRDPATDTYQPYSGPRDGPLSPLADLPRNSDALALYDLRLDPEGSILLLATFDLSASVGAVQRYHRDGTQWLRDPDLSNTLALVSVPSRGPDHRILGTNGTSDVTELSDASGTWQPIRTHSKTMLGVASVGSIWLSPDALRIVFLANAFDIPANRYMAYSDRATVDDLFGAARTIDARLADAPFISEDCGRYYFSGLRSVFYAESP